MRYILGCGDVDGTDFDEVKGPLAGSCEYGCQPSGSLNCGIFFDFEQSPPPQKKNRLDSVICGTGNTPYSFEC
jgi:hypothetical protein